MRRFYHNIIFENQTLHDDKQCALKRQYVTVRSLYGNLSEWVWKCVPMKWKKVVFDKGCAFQSQGKWTVALALAHNIVLHWDWHTGTVLQRVTCTEKCILYPFSCCILHLFVGGDIAGYGISFSLLFFFSSSSIFSYTFSLLLFISFLDIVYVLEVKKWRGCGALFDTSFLFTS